MAKAPSPRKTRRAAPDALNTRAYGGRRGPPSAVYEANAPHPLIPLVRAAPPSLTAQQQRNLQLLIAHLYRNNDFVRNVVNASCRLYVGDGPVPVSRFPELDELWIATSGQIDNTARRSFGAWLRQDVYRNVRLFGEAFVRRRDREDAPEAEDLVVPVEFEAFTPDFVPVDYNQVSFGLRYVCGIAHVRSKPVKYQVYADNPLEPGGVPQLLDLDRDEIYHVFDPTTGSPRGEVPLAASILRLLMMKTTEEAEARRKDTAARQSIFLKRPVDASDDEGMLPTDDEVQDLVDAIVVKAGAVNLLPYGYEMDSFSPPDEPANFEKSLRWHLMAVCASVGVPLYEVLGDDGVERWGRMMSQRVQAQARIEHDMLEHQLLNRMRADWIDAVQAAGLWTPPEDLKPWQLYECTWQWPPVPQARIDQELKSLIEAVQGGYLPHSHVARNIWGLKPAEVARQAARDAAQGTALGFSWPTAVWTATTPAAARIAARAEAEEAAELDLAEAAQLEDSVLDEDRI